MVTEVTAFRADDGSIHPSRLIAACHDAQTKLRELAIFNQGTILAVVEHAQEIIDALAPIFHEEDR